MGQGDDIVRVRGVQRDFTRVYLGEGNDEYTLGGSLRNNAYIFAEQDNDKVTITSTMAEGSSVYMGSGSDTLTISGSILGTSMGDDALIDLGSGNNMPQQYLATYQANGQSLSNDTNADIASDVNTVNLAGDMGLRASIVGGAGTDTINLTTSGRSLSLSQLTDIDVIDLTGTGNNTLNGVTSDNLANNNELYVRGDAGDRVNVGNQIVLINPQLGSFSKNGTQEKDGVTYDTWTDGQNHTIYIQQGIEVI